MPVGSDTPGSSAPVAGPTPVAAAAAQTLDPPLAAGYSPQPYYCAPPQQQQQQATAFSYPMVPGSPLVALPHMGFAGGAQMSPPAGAGYAYYASSGSPSGSPPMGAMMVGRAAGHFMVGDMAA
ncbi:hypothetical protein IWQ56_005132, partial [Coemansia nantahalensis]